VVDVDTIKNGVAPALSLNTWHRKTLPVFEEKNVRRRLGLIRLVVRDKNAGACMWHCRYLCSLLSLEADKTVWHVVVDCQTREFLAWQFRVEQ
jgi:hypothetical protein